MSNHSTIGAIESHTPERGVVGWCIEVDESGQPTGQIPELRLFAGEIFLRRMDPFEGRGDTEVEYKMRKAGFRLNISKAVAKAIPEGSILSVRDANGQNVPFADDYVPDPIGTATDEGAELVARLESGDVIDKWGSFKTPFSAKEHLRPKYMDALEHYFDYFFHRFGLMATPTYGTLLGLARGGEFLPHDDDVDLTVMFPSNKPGHVAADYWALIPQLEADGYRVYDPSTGQFHIGLPGSDFPVIDIFASWQTRQFDYFNFFAVGGNIGSRLRYGTAQLEGRTVVVPENYEQILEFMYGPHWLVPDTNFQWVVGAEVHQTMDELRRVGNPRQKRYFAEKAAEKVMEKDG